MFPPRLGCGQPIELAQVLVGALVEGIERPADGLHLVDADLVLVAVALPCAPSVVLLGVDEDADVYLAKVVEDGEPLLLDVGLHGPEGDGVVGDERVAVLVLLDGAVAELNAPARYAGVYHAALYPVRRRVALAKRARRSYERLSMLSTHGHLIEEVARQRSPVVVNLDVRRLVVHEVRASHDADELDDVTDYCLVGDVFHQGVRCYVVHQDAYGYLLQRP